MNKYIITESKNNIGLINLDRVEIKNALNLECINLLISAVEEFNNTDNIKCIILGSQSKEVFCSGLDLKDFAKKTELVEKSAYFDALAKLIITMKNCSKPIISKVHGFALAGGLSLIAASDIVYAANDSKFALPELKVGMVPGVVMTALEGLISKRALSLMCITADVIDAEEAFQIGLVSKVFDKSVLDKKTEELAKNITLFSKEAISTTKKMLSKKGKETFAQKLNLRAKEMAIYSLSPDCIEGTDAYLNKRKANWK